MLKLTVKDICAALGVPRHRVRAWTQLPPFRDQPTNARSARRFDILELLLMAILQSLEDNYGIRHSALEKAAPAIMRFLSRPRDSNDGDSAYLDISSWQMQPVTPELALHAGLIIDVERERERVVKFLGLGPVQGELLLGPVTVGQRKLGRPT
jgi:hypothetical protein